MEGRHFSSDAKVIAAADTWLDGQFSDFFLSGLQKLEFGRCSFVFRRVNHLKHTGYVTHHQFNIQQLYALPSLYLCVLYLSENKQLLVPLTA